LSASHAPDDDAEPIVAAARVELRESGDLRKMMEDRYHAACSALAGASQ
jgi:hypothetical protein